MFRLVALVISVLITTVKRESQFVVGFMYYGDLFGIREYKVIVLYSRKPICTREDPRPTARDCWALRL